MKDMSTRRHLQLNEWSLLGDWTVRGENAVLNGAGGSIVYRFHARDLHLVLGPAADGKPIRFRVTIDGKAPGVDHGTDIDADGQGLVDSQRLYQLVRHPLSGGQSGHRPVALLMSATELKQTLAARFS